MTDSECLVKIKKNLGFPYSTIEIADFDILTDIIHDSALKTFSKYFPNEILVKRDDCIQDINYDSLWIFPDYLLGQIITVKSVMDINGSLDFKYYHPDKIRIFGMGYSYSNSTTIVLKVLHNKDLTSIPINQEDIFIEYCTILLAEKILPIRREFSRMGTPIGDIEINSDVIQSYIDKKVEFIEKNFYNIAKMSKRMPIVFSAPYASTFDNDL